MHYRFAPDRNHSDLASGHVLRSAPGLPAFPVRLAEEMFGRALAKTQATSVSLLDPCCGAGYLLTVLGFLFPKEIRVLAGLDIDAKAVELARKNLRLLQPGGLQERIAELERLHEEHGRESHQAAIGSAESLLQARADHPAPKITVHLADATSPASVAEALEKQIFNFAVCDLPHGKLVSWQGQAASLSPDTILHGLFQAVAPALAADGLWIVAALKQQRLTIPEGYRRVERLRVGHREISLVQRA